MPAGPPPAIAQLTRTTPVYNLLDLTPQGRDDW
jgi:hypothetical protein